MRAERVPQHLDEKRPLGYESNVEVFYWLPREDPGEQPTLIFSAFPLKMGVPGRGCALECKCFTGSPGRTPGSSPRSLAAAYAVLQSIILYWRKILLTLCDACSCSFLRVVNQRCGDAWVHCFDRLAASLPKIWIPGKGHFQPLAYKGASTH